MPRRLRLALQRRTSTTDGNLAALCGRHGPGGKDRVGRRDGKGSVKGPWWVIMSVCYARVKTSYRGVRRRRMQVKSIDTNYLFAHDGHTAASTLIKRVILGRIACIDRYK